MSTLQDLFADFLTRVRQRARAQKLEVVTYSEIKAEIARIFQRGRLHLGFIRSTRAARIRESRSSINLWTDQARLRDCGGLVAPVCAVTLARMKSRGSLVEWVLAILSTSRGILSGREARKQKVGGELLAYVW